MANTPFLDLVKPAGTDRALVSVINSNSDKIDTGVSTLSEQITTKYAKFNIENESIVSSDVHSLGQGNYRMNGGAANLPVAVAGVATVIYRNSNTKWLTYRTDDGRIYEQMCASGTWTAWQQLATQNVIDYTSSISLNDTVVKNAVVNLNRVGKSVYFHGYIVTNASLAKNDLILTLPSGAFPLSNYVYVPGTKMSDQGDVMFLISSNGQFKIDNLKGQTIPANTYLQFDIVFVAAN